MLDTSKNYVFLSYSHKDKTEINRLIKWLDSKGINVIYDKTFKGGDKWILKAKEYISSPKCMGALCVITKNSLISASVKLEVDFIAMYKKNSFCVTLNGSTLDETLKSITLSRENYDIVHSILDNFDEEEVFIPLTDDMEKSKEEYERLEETLFDWGVDFERRIKGLDFVHADLYSADAQGERDRLHSQHLGYVDFDKSIIDFAVKDFTKDGLVVLDLGCSDGQLTASRFKDDRFKTVIGVDINPTDINTASSAGYGDKFHFYIMDLDDDEFIDNLTEELRKINVESVDLVFIALTLHHLQRPENLLYSLNRIFSEDGKIVVRGADDGNKICYPESELMEEFLKRYNALVKNRFYGRKIYNHLCNNGYENITMMYQVSDTCGKTLRDKIHFYKVGFEYRKNKLTDIANKYPNNEELRKDIEWQLDALSKIEKLFGQKDFWFSNTSYAAIASVG